MVLVSMSPLYTSHNMDANLALRNHDSTESRGDDPRRETCPSGSVHDSLDNVRISRESACFCPYRVYPCRVDADVAASHVVAADHQAEPPQNLFLKQAPIMDCRPANCPTLSCTSPHSCIRGREQCRAGRRGGALI